MHSLIKISFSEQPENYICPSKFPLDFIITNALFKELCWKSGFPEQGTCDDSDSDKLLLLSHIMSSDPCQPAAGHHFPPSLLLNVYVKLNTENSLESRRITSKMKAGNSIRLLKGGAFWYLTNALSTFRFPLSSLRYTVCLERELPMGELPQCSFFSTQGNSILDTSELCDHKNTTNIRNPETAASA